VIELVVVTAIIGILSTVVIVSQGSFSRTILLKNTAADIALSLRSAQVFGIGSQSTSNFETNAPYGIDFSSAGTNSYIFFADTAPSVAYKASTSGTPSNPASKSGDGVYCPTSGYPTECSNSNKRPDVAVQTYTLNNGMTIDNFCAYVGASKYCKTGGTTSGMTHLSITFTRPNPSAAFKVLDGAGATVVASFDQACITVKSPAQVQRAILVTAIGQITLISLSPSTLSADCP